MSLSLKSCSALKKGSKLLHTSVRCSSYHKKQEGDFQANSKEDPTLNFSFAKHGNFLQAEPKHQNSYTSDGFLQSYLRVHMPKEILSNIEPDLDRFGHECAHEIWDLGQQCEQNPPYLRQYNAWGGRIDEIVTCPAWKQQKRVAAKEGLISIPYKNEQDIYSRLYQCSKLYMYSPASGLYNCPLAMTDAAAKTIHSLKLDLPEAWNHLTSRDPNLFWTSGQWMTERQGGSDVGQGTETLAVPQQDGSYKLYGYKWFSSATDSDMTMTLARVVDSQNSTVSGGKGISMFYLKIRNQDGALNNIQVVKLKNKLGTRQLPTAELLLDGADATLVSPEGRGIPSISSMLTISRLHNGISSAAIMRKMVSLARDYSTRRKAFGDIIANQPLHVQTLARMEVETRGCSILMFELARLLGQQDNNSISDQDLLLLRLMTPVAKLYTAKQAVAVCSEGLECFGGQGYIEDTGIPALLRDAQVLPIWEGTTNILSLDVVRAIAKTKGEVLKAFLAKITEVQHQAEKIENVGAGVDKIAGLVHQSFAIINKHPEILEFCARDLSFTLANTYIGTLLLEHALRTGHKIDVDVATAWMDREMAPILNKRNNQYTAGEFSASKNIVFQNYTEQD